MAAGFITKTVGDGNGGTFSARFWSSDGTTGGLLYPAPVVTDSTGAALDYSVPALTEGGIAHDSPVSTGKPVVIAGRGASANPTAVSADGDVTRIMTDLKGRVAVVPHQIRELHDEANLTLTSTTTATELIAAGAAGVYNDIVSLTLVNTSATATEVQILNTDGTTVRWEGYVPAGDMRGIVFPVPLKGSATASAWKAKSVTSVASLKITAQYVKNV